jgi:hypothetical protein
MGLARHYLGMVAVDDENVLLPYADALPKGLRTCRIIVELVLPHSCCLPHCQWLAGVRNQEQNSS